METLMTLYLAIGVPNRIPLQRVLQAQKTLVLADLSFYLPDHWASFLWARQELPTGTRQKLPSPAGDVH